jgi:hypothetical protein
MIVVRVELWSAVTHEVTELARMKICNRGGTAESGDYSVTTYRGRCKADLDRHVVTRTGAIAGYPRLALHVWHLVAYALASTGYFRGTDQLRESEAAAIKQGLLQPVGDAP